MAMVCGFLWYNLGSYLIVLKCFEIFKLLNLYILGQKKRKFSKSDTFQSGIDRMDQKLTKARPLG